MVQKKCSSPRSKIGIILFLCIYGLLVALAVVVLFRMMTPLRQWLVEYEGAQLESKSAQVFEEYFADPDWEKIYDVSGREDTLYEGAAAYVTYMDAKVGDMELTYQEITSGLPGVHRYHVYLGTEKVATFTMTGTEATFLEIPQWTLDSVEIYFERTINVIVEKKPEYTIYINGVALDDSFTIRSTATEAEKYLPEGIHGYHLDQQYIDGLLVQPEVRVVNENGEIVPISMDPETGVYTLQLPEPSKMTTTEETLARNAAIADAKFSMRKITAAELGKYFDVNSQVYADIVGNPLFIQGYKSYYIDEAIQVGDFYRYSDDCFCAKVKLTVNVIREDDTVKVYPLDKTYFFTRGDSGEYLVSAYTNEAVQERVEQVRLTFVMGDEEQISNMVASGTDPVTLPEIAVPEGKKLVGWAVKTYDGDTITMTVRLLPNGAVLGELEPMTLYPVFQEIGA